MPGEAVEEEKEDDEDENVTGDFKLEIKEAHRELKLSWDKQDEKNFKYYKVVASKSNSNPVYPKDGYLEFITEVDRTNSRIRGGGGYTNGDFSKFEDGKEYYIRITAVYEKDGKRSYKNSNVIKMMVPYTTNQNNDNQNNDNNNEQEASEEFKLNIAKVSDGIDLTWTKVPSKQDHYGFRFYKVVASKANSNPVYPQDGYATYITDINKLKYHISVGDSYTKRKKGDVDKFEAGQEYYIRITAVYEDKHYLQSNVIKTKVK